MGIFLAPKVIALWCRHIAKKEKYLRIVLLDQPNVTTGFESDLSLQRAMKDRKIHLKTIETAT
jgi:hypothetical protein